ncbi:hypothetical protein [Streptomyces sp. NPDC005859]|uniref:hypothetical protein n=1 Tax=Streptomyces sp. NPDC005859 TaxID=3157170 RepID=UPI0034001D0A
MSTDRPRPKRATQIAIGFLTLWAERDRSFAAAHISTTLGLADVPEPARSEITSAIAGLLNLSMMAVMEVGQRRAFEAAEASGRHRDDVSVEERLAATSAYIQEMSLGMPEDPDAVDRS